ncbi:MAG TPA: DUF1800 domain-containing protein [Gemmatimonadaceae bacterium]|nr:DUF1800 domain-containing protein [Gemmatimonadaceae bacterium]
MEERTDTGIPDADRPDEPRSRRSFFFFGALAGASALFSRAAGAQVSRPRRPLRPRPVAPEFPTAVVNESVAALPDWTNSRVRLVRRVTMGVTAADLNRVNQLGYQEYLNRQLSYREIDDSAVDAAIAARYPLLSAPAATLFASAQGTLQQQLQEATIYRAAFSERQLYERMVEFWSDHFNIAFTKVGYLKVIDDRDVIRRHALGRFRDLLMATAKSPAMLAYLDQTQSRRGAPNENYVRELMELHTVGVDGGYTQTDVAELARVFTGWTIQGQGSFYFNPNLHDFGAKVVMGQSFPATSSSVGAEAIGEGERFVNFLASHPNTATFISTKLLRWLLQAEPTAHQIAVATRAWRATGGNIRLVVRAILNESWLAAAPAKFKRPFHFLVSALRATDAQVNAATVLPGRLNILGQPLFTFETPDGYPDKVEYWSGNIMPRWSFASYVAAQNSATGLRVTTTPYLSGTPDAAIDLLSTEFFGGEMSMPLRLALLGYLKAGTFNDGRVRETIALALSSSEFQWY